MPEPSRKPRPSSAALAALATVVLYGLGSLSGLAHLALARHQVCPDHGELVHGGHGHRSDAAAPVPVDRAVFAVAVVPDGHGHDHCAVADHLRQAGVVAPPPAPGVAPSPAERAPAPPAERAHRPVATLRLAPKHSPPVAA